MGQKLMPRIYRNKRDSVEQSIVDALEAAGCIVERGQDCDLYVKTKVVRTPTENGGYVLMGGFPMLVEVKDPKRKKTLRPIQKRLQAMFGFQYVVVSTVQDALRACGIQVDER